MEVFPAGYRGFFQEAYDTTHHNAENACRANVWKAAAVPPGRATLAKTYPREKGE